MNFYIGLLVVAVIGFAYFGLPLYWEWHRLQLLTEKAPLQSSEWKVKTVNEEDYRVEVHYSYQVDGKKYEKQELFQGEKYRNPYKAEGAIADFKKEYQTVAYNPKNPEDSSLETYFPTKRAVYLLVLFFLFNYFLLLVRSYSKDKLKAMKKPEDPLGKGRP